MSEQENPNKESFMQQNYFLSRIDRSIADNLKSIESSFFDDAGIVKDFIVFISKRLKYDLFGFTTFTLGQFCKETGRNKQTLCEVHPFFINNKKASPPVYNGHTFKTVFDFALLNMIRHNIVFDKSYTYNNKGETTHLTKFSILQDIKLNHDRNNGNVKLYEIRLAPEVIEGFLQRYYIIDTKGYSKIGKGRGGDGRKSLYVLLEKTRHILLSRLIPSTKFTVDYLAGIAGIVVEEPKNRKTSLKRVLEAMRTVGELNFTYQFVRGDLDKPYQEEYWVELTFHDLTAEVIGDNIFFLKLMEELTFIFSDKYKQVEIKDEKDPFQRWVTNNSKDINLKIDAIAKSFFKAYNKEITKDEARTMLLNGKLWDLIEKRKA
ncbi:hypothetical protein [Adhaeribacter aquaticus]|uniref:hypothetical protein n=1 Tax=Adhaeribacter aquaticus TaxID=299567 RepID=UPI00047A3197|nr:hypothetical protein [Adhaeribacter aquaticus]